MQAIYRVHRLAEKLTPDANWNKAQWQPIPAIQLNYYMGEQNAFMPKVEVKLAHDNEAVYIIFKVDDRYVRCMSNIINYRMWEDSCVEFFFSPDLKQPERYFNLETNCGGTALFHYNLEQKRKKFIYAPEKVIQIEIAHSLPELILDEITEPLTWTLEYRLPITLVEEFADVTTPLSGTSWRANFYKCGDKTSNPHFITWAEVKHPVPNFHLPEFFGELQFE
ncbi:carbohydrate-binding family 9-like protein [Mangrovibacterium sp.]|uniref:carbohydrate-binding family 9-like protein n=1 Tax=Mangrovibacterium sp. TaxID=1961364 RepID=UPI003562B7F0